MPHAYSTDVNGSTPYYNLARRIAFPSSYRILIASLLFTIFGSGLAFTVAKGSPSNFLTGAASGILVLALPAFCLDVILYTTIMKSDPLFYFRRCLALSLFTINAWIAVFIGSSVLARFIPGFIFPEFAILLGLFVVGPLRCVIVFSISRVNLLKRTIFSLAEPTVEALVAVPVLGIPFVRVSLGLVLSCLVALTFTFAAIALMEVYGRKMIGFSPFRMFKAFLTDWMEGENREIESCLTQLGVETEIATATFLFKAKGAANPKGVMLVSNVHPGPVLNIGSSILPYLFQAIVNRRLNAVGMFPHGVSGHELNLVSQDENARVIGWTLERLKDACFLNRATRVVRAKNDMATATSQIFDGCALVTMTTSPHDMEDIPGEVAEVLNDSSRGALRHVALVDAHNCLAGVTSMTREKVDALQDAALLALKSSKDVPSSPFKVGVAQIAPVQFSLKEGFGPGGISAIAVEVDGERFAYINIDGNNMIRGLREEILETVKGIGFSDGEVMTTDTHAVNGVVSARLGYYRIGEAVPKQRLLEMVADVCRKAMQDLEPSEVAVLAGRINALTFGSTSIRHIMSVIYKLSRLTALVLLPAVGAIAVIFLAFLV